MSIRSLSRDAVQSITTEALSSVLSACKTVAKLRAECLAVVIRNLIPSISHQRESAIVHVVTEAGQHAVACA